MPFRGSQLPGRDERLYQSIETKELLNRHMETSAIHEDDRELKLEFEHAAQNSAQLALRDQLRNDVVEELRTTE